MSDELVYMYMYVLYMLFYIVLEGSVHVYMHM